MYGSGDFVSFDPGAYILEGDLLQTYYWRRYKGTKPVNLNARWNFRGYKCSYADLGGRIADIRIVYDCVRINHCLPLAQNEEGQLSLCVR